MTLGEHLQATAERLANKTALICGDTLLSYREFNEQTTRLALGLQAKGIRKGDRVVLHMNNTVELSLAYFGCFKAGAIAVPINSRLKTDEIEYMLRHCEARMYIGEPDLYQLAEPTRGSCPHVAHFFVTAEGEASDATPCFRDLLNGPAGGSLPAVADSDVAVIIYSSGTTARPKGVTHTHASLRNCGLVTSQMGFREGDTFALFTPMSHASGLGCVLIPGVLIGMTLALIPAFDPRAVLRVVERHRCTLIGGLPAALQILVREQSSSTFNVESLRFCLGGGDSVAVSLQTEFQDAFGVPIQEAIGMTEAYMTCFNRSDRIKTGSVGQAVEGVEIRILDEHGRDLPLGEAGEMVIRHPGTAAGYWNDPEGTSAAIRDGWLYTGDLAFKDNDGFYWFAGRKKEIIIRGGSNISPQEVEEVLLKHPAVFQAGVVGTPDPTWGESIVAFVRPHDGASRGEQELIEFAKQHLADYKTPEQIHFIDEMPLGLTGKVHRKTLKEMAMEQQAACA
jgi:long-chain acyl-CoA synthetase